MATGLNAMCGGQHLVSYILVAWYCACGHSAGRRTRTRTTRVRSSRLWHSSILVEANFRQKFGLGVHTSSAHLLICRWRLRLGYVLGIPTYSFATGIQAKIQINHAGISIPIGRILRVGNQYLLRYRFSIPGLLPSRNIIIVSGDIFCISR